MRIVEIDFARGRVRADAGRVDSEAFRRLVALAEAAQAAGLTDVAFSHRSAGSSTWRHAIERVAVRSGARTIECGDEAWVCPAQEDGDVVWSVDDGDGALYRMRLSDMPHALARVTAAASLIAAAAALDEFAAVRLRFSLYELAVNTVEHGSFSNATAAIETDVAIATDAIVVTYRDTADPFATDSTSHVDIGRKIAAGDKRGLGLFILHGMSAAFTYERVGGHNVTTITLNGAPDGAPRNERSHRMDGITVEITPCELESTAVITPVGSLDSNTARVLESHLGNVIERGTATVVVDLSKVTFISSAGVGIFLGTVSRLRQNGGDLVFMRVPTHVAEVFDIINLGSYFRTVDSVDELAAVEG